jgi:D-serine deaminase-like pyridoxal phosphate-dependent protein
MVVEDEEQARELTRALNEVDPDLLTPALVIDLDAVEHNIDRIVKHVGHRRAWRPHVKTVKQSRIVRLLLERGVGSLKCATVDELALVLDTAERVHPEGHVDVLMAYPLTRNALRATVSLARDYEGGRIKLLADSPEHLRALVDWLGSARPPRPFEVLLDVDVGMRRTGSSAQVWRAAQEDLRELRELRIVGVHGYEGHLGWGQRAQAHACHDELVDLAMALGSIELVVTSGSHSFDHALAHSGLRSGTWLHQVSPGTIVLSDRRSEAPAAALGLRQAVFVATRVISRPADDRITVDAGTKALSPDIPAPSCSVLGKPHLEGLEGSEEHRPFSVREGERPALGELLWLVPDHACTTVNLHRRVLYVRAGRLVGKGSVEAMSRTNEVGARRP